MWEETHLGEYGVAEDALDIRFTLGRLCFSKNPLWKLDKLCKHSGSESLLATPYELIPRVESNAASCGC